MAKQIKRGGHSRRAIAAQAARLMAEDGIADFGAAKRKAARQLGYAESDPLPSNDEVDGELRAYHRLFRNDEQRSRLGAMREIALDLMTQLARHQPCLTGPVWTGTAGSESAIDIDLFADSAKMVEVWLLDGGIPYRVQEWPHFNRALDRKVPVMTFDHRGHVVNLIVYDVDDRRGALRRDAGGASPRGDAAALEVLLREARASVSPDQFLADIR